MSNSGQKMVKGAIILSLAGMIAKIISVLYKIPLTFLVKEEGLGYYQTVYPIYTLLTAAAFIGIPSTVSKMIAETYEIGDYKKGQTYFEKALIINGVLGVLMTIIMILGTPMMIRLLNWDPNTKYVLYGFSLSPFFVVISGVLRGYFQGQEKMGPSAMTQVIENGIKVLMGIGLVVYLLDQSEPVSIAVGGAAIGVSIAFVFSALYMWIIYLKDKDHRGLRLAKDNQEQIEVSYGHVFKTIVVTAIPMTIVSASYSVMNAIDSSTLYHIFGSMKIESFQVVTWIGRLGKVFSIINVPLTIAIGISIAILPSIAIAKANNDLKELEIKMKSSLGFALVVILPSAFGIALLAREILGLIYPGIEGGAQYLIYYSICLVFMVISQIMASILQGLSKPMLPLYSLMVAAVVKIALNYLLVNTTLMIQGALIASIVYYIIFLCFNYYYMSQVSGIKIHLIKIGTKPLIASVVMSLGIYGMRIAFAQGSHKTWMTLTYIVLGVIIYSITLLRLKYFDLNQIEALPIPMTMKSGMIRIADHHRKKD